MEQKLYELNEKATEIYNRELYRSYTALAYFSKRHIKLNEIELFRLGYASGRYNIYEYLKCEGFSDDVIIASGLVKRQEDGSIVERYRNRIIFPIINEDNKVVAFGGRVIDDNIKPKYINSPETIIYSKGKNLYGIHRAKNYAEDGLILVEGYIDVIILNQVGIKNVVALLGTAITDEQIKIIKRYTNKVIIAFDSDLAGTKAALITQEKFKKYNIECLSIKLDNAKDVDEYINKYGTDKLKILLDT